MATTLNLPPIEHIDAGMLEAAAARLAELSLREFVEDAWHVVEPGTPLIPGWHIDAICEHLEGCTRGEIQRLIINIPPRCMKSLLVCVFWPAWVWVTQPHTRWLFASYSHHLSQRDSLRCRDVIQSPWYQSHWANRFRLRLDQNQKTRFHNDHGGIRLATSIGGVGTGEGGDFIVVDDPHNVSAVESDTERDTAIRWWDQSMSTRGNQPSSACHVVVMQRLHERDLTGHLLAQGGYEHLCLPMEFERSRRCVTSLGWRDPRKKEEELLCPGHFGRPEVAELRLRLGSYGAAGQLQQRPAPREGGMFQRSWFQVVPTAPGKLDSTGRSIRRVRYWDLAASPEGDYTCGVLLSRRADNMFFVEDVRRGRWSPAQRDNVILQTAKSDGHDAHIVIEQEPGAAGQSVTDSLRRLLVGFPCWGERPTGTKLVRAQPLASYCEGGNVCLIAGPWNEAYLDELCFFPNGAHDDQVDASAGAFNRLAQRTTSDAVPQSLGVKPPDPRRHGIQFERPKR